MMTDISNIFCMQYLESIETVSSDNTTEVVVTYSTLTDTPQHMVEYGAGLLFLESRNAETEDVTARTSNPQGTQQNTVNLLAQPQRLYNYIDYALSEKCVRIFEKEV